MTMKCGRDDVDVEWDGDEDEGMYIVTSRDVE